VIVRVIQARLEVAALSPPTGRLPQRLEFNA